MRQIHTDPFVMYVLNAIPLAKSSLNRAVVSEFMRMHGFLHINLILSLLAVGLKSHFSVCFEYVYKTTQGGLWRRMKWPTVMHHSFPLCYSAYMETDVAFRSNSKGWSLFHNNIPQAKFRESDGGVCKGGEESWWHCECCVLELCRVTALHF